MTVKIPDGQDPLVPLPGFNFHVSFDLKLFRKISNSGQVDVDKKPVSDSKAIVGGFTDISGLEATMEPKTIRSGGDNYNVHQRAGTVSFATVVLKRGMVSSRHLWGWWSLFAGANHALNGGWAKASRSDVSIYLMEGRKPIIGWKLERAMPVKFRVGDLSASSGELAIEELHLAHEGLHMVTGL